MKTNCLRSFFLAALFFCLNQFASASHLAGGEITYMYTGNGNDYAVYITLYRDCMAGPAAATIPYSVSAVSCGLTSSQQANLLSQQEFQITCSSILTYCNGGTQPGFEKCVYTDTITLPPCSDWIIFYEELYRNAAITTLNSPSSLPLQISSTLDNLNFSNNSASQFLNDPRFFIGYNMDTKINNGAFDPDGDSISVSLAPVNNNPTVYNPGYSATQPLSSTPPITVNSITGDVDINSSAIEVGVIVYKVEEYRNGQLIGSAMRDVLVYTWNDNNQYPFVVSQPNQIITICANDSLNMVFTLKDLDFDSTFYTNYSFSAPPQYFTTYESLFQPDTLHLVFNPDSTLISTQPYLLHLNFRDNHCPVMGVQQLTYQIYVVNCSNNVWPGDADADLTCDIGDVLPIGLAYGSTGPVRPGASISWTAQAGVPWGNTFSSGLDYMHADCNGDGTIDANDTVAISQNFGQTHPLRLANPEHEINSLASLYTVASVDTINESGSFTVEVRLGSDAFPVDELYGIVFRLHFNEEVINSAASHFDVVNSWLGTTGTDLLAFTKPVWSGGYIDVAAVRTNQLNVGGDSTIAVFSVVIVDNVSTQSCSNFRLSNVTGIKSNGELVYFGYAGDSVLVTDLIDGIQKLNTVDVMLYPNPAQTSVTLTSKENITAVEIYNQLGEMVSSTVFTPARTQQTQVSQLPKGVYNLHILTEKGSANRTLVK